MTKITPLISLLILILNISLNAQDQRSWLENISTLRSKIIENESAKFEFLDSLMQHWDVINHLEYEDKLRFLVTTNHASRNETPMPKKPFFIHKPKDLEYQGNPYGNGDHIRPDIQSAIEYCGIPVSLLNRKYVELKFPHKVTFGEEFAFDLDLFNIQEGDDVLLYRNDDGIIPWLYHLLHPQSNITFAIEETDHLQYLQRRYAEYPELNFHLGRYNSTKLSDNSFDKIIFFRKCSGFERSNKFIKSIFETIKQNGKVILIEPGF